MTKTKTELLSEMRELQQQYAERAQTLKDMNFEEEKAEFEKRQLAYLEEFKGKYKFYASLDGTAKGIDWDEVEKLIRASFVSFGKDVKGYALGTNQLGVQGLGANYGDPSSLFTPMVEDEVEARRYAEREERRAKFIEKAQQQNQHKKR